MTIEEIERALDAGQLEVQTVNGNYRTIRRNGATKRWKTDLNRFRIPIKVGLYTYGAIDTVDLAVMHIRLKDNFV